MTNFLKKNLYKIGLMIFILIFPVLSLAADDGLTIKNPLKSQNIIDLIRTVLEGVIKIAMPVIVLAVIYCGFLFVAAQGKSEKLGDAKRALSYTLVGAAILLGSWAIAQLIVSTVQSL